jgi:hypothetical protein
MSQQAKIHNIQVKDQKKEQLWIPIVSSHSLLLCLPLIVYYYLFFPHFTTTFFYSNRIVKDDNWFLSRHLLQPPLLHLNWLNRLSFCTSSVPRGKLSLSILCFPYSKCPKETCPCPCYLLLFCFYLPIHMLLHLSCLPSLKMSSVPLTSELYLSPSPRTQTTLRNKENPVVTFWAGE